MFNQIGEDLKEALKNQEKLVLSVLRIDEKEHFLFRRINISFYNHNF